MFVQIVITKSETGTFKLVFFDEGGVVFTERMTDQQIADTIFTSLQNLRAPNIDLPR
jgi:hypothetical protein